MCFHRDDYCFYNFKKGKTGKDLLSRIFWYVLCIRIHRPHTHTFVIVVSSRLLVSDCVLRPVGISPMSLGHHWVSDSPHSSHRYFTFFTPVFLYVVILYPILLRFFHCFCRFVHQPFPGLTPWPWVSSIPLTDVSSRYHRCPLTNMCSPWLIYSYIWFLLYSV